MRNTSDAKATWKNVAAIDLKNVREQLNLNKGWWWRLWHNPMQLELEYRRFLFLLAMNSDNVILPWSDDLNISGLSISAMPRSMPSIAIRSSAR